MNKCTLNKGKKPRGRPKKQAQELIKTKYYRLESQIAEIIDSHAKRQGVKPRVWLENLVRDFAKLES